MASTTALFTGLSGLNAHARKLDVIGNNIANINTTAYKSNRMNFAPMFSRTLSLGSRPDGAHGGSNPGQIGLGVKIAGTQRILTDGSISTTGINTDLAIEGDGFFIVENADGQAYTRAGAFQLNADHDLVSISGDKVQGYGIDTQFNLTQGALSDVNIPLGTLTIAEATEHVRIGGNLNADGEVGLRGTVISTPALTNTAGATVTTATLLTAMQHLTDPLGTAMFDAGDTFRVSGATKDGQELPDADLAVTAATTIADLLSFFNDLLGVITGQSVLDEDDAAATSGAQLDPTTGAIRIIGNTGTVSDITLTASNATRLDSDGALVEQPLTFTRGQSATGESVRTQFVTYDSLGSELIVDLAFVLESKSDAGNTWRYYAESTDDSDLARALTLPDDPVITFDPYGNLMGTTSFDVSLDRADTGAATPLTFTVDLESESDRVQQLADTRDGSEIAATYQDGSPIGTLADFGVGINGTISGSFTNGLTRTIGQIALATFTNPEGLVDRGNNLFAVGPNSGTALIGTPQSFGAGSVLGGSLELSNVDLSQEFTEMILTTTGYTASSRVISTTNELMQQLLLLGR
ncbi:MAG: flagellar hook-basal body complex protein [Phycisphaerales bacterium]|nr:flagellar hook-basal body complex protein [Phycisphaerales bacterium]